MRNILLFANGFSACGNLMLVGKCWLLTGETDSLSFILGLCSAGICMVYLGERQK